MPRLPLQDPIIWLLGRKYQPLKVRASLGLLEDSRSIDGDKDFLPDSLRQEIIEEHHRLKQLPEDQIGELVEAENAEILRQQQEENLRLLQRISADYGHWIRAARWSIEESAFLLRRIDPRKVNRHEWLREKGRREGIGQEIRDLHDLLRRAHRAGLINDPTHPSNIIAWAKEQLIELPKVLLQAAEKCGIEVPDRRRLIEDQQEQIEQLQAKIAELSGVNDAPGGAKIKAGSAVRGSASADDKPLGTTERNSLLTLVIGMAVKGYGYDPAAKRNDSTGDIFSDLHSLGIGMDQNTIRKYLREGADLLPGDALEDRDESSE